MIRWIAEGGAFQTYFFEANHIRTIPLVCYHIFQSSFINTSYHSWIHVQVNAILVSFPEFVDTTFESRSFAFPLVIAIFPTFYFHPMEHAAVDLDLFAFQ